MNKFVLIALASLGISATASANELIASVAEVDAKNGAAGGMLVSFDLAVERPVMALSFSMSVPGAEKAKIDLSKCASELPAGFVGQCAVNGDEVMLFAYTMDPKADLAAGVHRVGTIRIGGLRGADLRKAGEIRFEDVSVGSPGGEKALKVAPRVERLTVER